MGYSLYFKTMEYSTYVLSVEKLKWSVCIATSNVHKREILVWSGTLKASISYYKVCHLPIQCSNSITNLTWFYSYRFQLMSEIGQREIENSCENSEHFNFNKI